MSTDRKAEIVQEIWVTLQVNARKQEVCPQHRCTNTDAAIDILSKATNFVAMNRIVNIHHAATTAILRWIYQLHLRTCILCETKRDCWIVGAIRCTGLPSQASTYCKVNLEKLTVAQQVKKSQSFVEFKCPVPSYLLADKTAYPEPEEKYPYQTFFYTEVLAFK
jgi:hypothetical protein